MTTIDRPALRVSSHQRRAAALADFVHRVVAKRMSVTHPGALLDSAGIERLLREEGVQN